MTGGQLLSVLRTPARSAEEFRPPALTEMLGGRGEGSRPGGDTMRALGSELLQARPTIRAPQAAIPSIFPGTGYTGSLRFDTWSRSHYPIAPPGADKKPKKRAPRLANFSLGTVAGGLIEHHRVVGPSRPPGRARTFQLDAGRFYDLHSGRG